MLRAGQCQALLVTLGTPIVGSRLVRKFSYAFAAVCPHDGVMDSLILP